MPKAQTCKVIEILFTFPCVVGITLIEKNFFNLGCYVLKQEDVFIMVQPEKQPVGDIY